MDPHNEPLFTAMEKLKSRFLKVVSSVQKSVTLVCDPPRCIHSNTHSNYFYEELTALGLNAQ